MQPYDYQMLQSIAYLEAVWHRKRDGYLNTQNSVAIG